MQELMLDVMDDAGMRDALHKAFYGNQPDRILVLRLPSQDGIEVEWVEGAAMGDLLERISSLEED